MQTIHHMIVALNTSHDKAYYKINKNRQTLKHK